MLTYIKGNLFISPAKVLVNTVNTVGVMGKGIAKTFKEIYPDMFKHYQYFCEKGGLKIGNLWLYKTSHKWILNFPTKQDWREPSKVEYIETGLKKFVSTYSEQGITSIAFPKLGCGNGELDWKKVVQPLMVRYLKNLEIDIFIYEFDNQKSTPEHKDIIEMSKWLHSEPRTLSFSEMWTDLSNIIGSGISMTTYDNNATKFSVKNIDSPNLGLNIHIMSRKKWIELTNKLLSKIVPSKWHIRIGSTKDIFIPQEALLDLWQNIRLYGFCIPRIMPGELYALAEYIMPLMSRLDYMKPIKLSTPEEEKIGDSEYGLQLYEPPKSKLTMPSDLLLKVQVA